jgi:hypothetical protein
MMEKVKVWMRIDAAAKEGDIAYLKTIATQLLDQVSQHPLADPPGYRVINVQEYDPPGLQVFDGTRNTCIGYASAQSGCIVACGSFIVWPEEQWGDETSC